MRAHERETGTLWFGVFDGRTWYVPAATDPARLEALAASLNEPQADTGPLLHALAELWVCTKHDRMPDEDRKAMLAIYAGRLAAYPQGPVLAVLADMSETAEWFPKWAELQERLARYAGWRTTFRQALRRIYLKLTAKDQDT